MSDIIEEAKVEELPVVEVSLLAKAKSAAMNNQGLIIAGVAAVAVAGIGYMTYRYCKHLSLIEDSSRQYTDAVKAAAARGEITTLYDLDKSMVYLHPDIAVELACKNNIITDEEARKAYDYLDEVAANSTANALAMNSLLSTMINGDTMNLVQVGEGNFNIRTGPLHEAIAEVFGNDPLPNPDGKKVINYL